MNREFLPLLPKTDGADPEALGYCMPSHQIQNKPEGSIHPSSKSADQSTSANHPQARANTVAPTSDTCAQDVSKAFLNDGRHGSQKPESIAAHPGKIHQSRPFHTNTVPDTNPGPAPGPNQPGSSARGLRQTDNSSSSSRSNEDKASSERRVTARVAQMGSEMYSGTQYRRPGWYHTLWQMSTPSRNASEEPGTGPFPDVQTANDTAWQATKQLIDVDPRLELFCKRFGPDGQMKFLGASRERFISCRVWKQE
ncbi:MAG: hypothetical protein Q9212_002165 [Teloschistes hypoglaucus]